MLPQHEPKPKSAPSPARRWGEKPTLNPEPEGIRRTTRIEYGSKTLDISERREGTAHMPGSDFGLEYGRQMADFEEGQKHPPIQKNA
jgi:hypothetical protein